MLVFNKFPALSETANNGTYNGYLNFFTWANAGYNYGSLSETHSYGIMASAVGKLPTVLIIL